MSRSINGVVPARLGSIWLLEKQLVPEARKGVNNKKARCDPQAFVKIWLFLHTNEEVRNTSSYMVSDLRKLTRIHVPKLHSRFSFNIRSRPRAIIGFPPLRKKGSGEKLMSDLHTIQSTFYRLFNFYSMACQLLWRNFLKGSLRFYILINGGHETWWEFHRRWHGGAIIFNCRSFFTSLRFFTFLNGKLFIESLKSARDCCRERNEKSFGKSSYAKRFYANVCRATEPVSQSANDWSFLMGPFTSSSCANSFALNLVSKVNVNLMLSQNLLNAFRSVGVPVKKDASSILVIQMRIGLAYWKRLPRGAFTSR